MKDLAIFISSVFAVELLPKLMSNNIFPDIFTFKNEIHRKSFDVSLSSYETFFKINYIAENRFSQSSIQNRFSYDKVIAIDWSKDFFDTKFQFLLLYMQPALLPMFRGYGAITEQFLQGVCIGGVTFYIPSEITDAGDIIYQKEIAISFDDYPMDYIGKICDEIVNFLFFLEKGELQTIPQDERYSFSIKRVRRKEGIINFRADAVSVYNKIRGYSKPFFGAYCYFKDCKITVFRAKPEKWQGSYGKPGEIINIDKNGIEVACGNGTVMLTDMLFDESINLEKGFILNY